ncbi:MAG TPA: response regulator transcription factor [Candidatus Marinimicrobia bacterium]|nr:response regulator transcription factor [Candidatus Neomarinimicrobiota bacterium]
MIKVLIADDHSLIREGFKKIIARESDITVVGEAADSSEVMGFLEKQSCDIVVLDITMPGKNGLDILGDIRLRYPDLNVLILSMHAVEHYALRALKNGARGYLTKESAPDELIKAIRKINGGRMYISQEVAEQLAYNIGGKSEKMPHDNLSDREFQVLQLLAKGKTISEIGEMLAISASTVSTYRQRILEKLNLKNTSELILYAVNNRLIE